MFNNHTDKGTALMYWAPLIRILSTTNLQSRCATGVFENFISYHASPPSTSTVQQPWVARDRDGRHVVWKSSLPVVDGHMEEPVRGTKSVWTILWTYGSAWKALWVFGWKLLVLR
ncbi:hypothetical protein L873DRAFT_751348 [Choiromyces venosus 120613-1]|uniref:Uncharacterized protein n=1 Tax=Choiromyces venosus 120613-1 TaxID=1336337 RepID=A0A3N4IVS8_9PEZI|nr:hypothetical protein L873DRAFT_751348 [Choiromyces venosus 120613-1]